MTPVSYVQPAATAPYGVGTPLPGRARIDLIPPAPALPRVGTPPAQVPIPPAPSEQNLEQNLSAMAEAVTKLVGPPAQEPEPPEGAPADPDDESPAAVASRPPAVGTAASTIADLLRHGSSQLFFDRSDPDD
jgi:hypothetical protein